MSAQESVLQAGEILDRRYRIISDGMPLDIGAAYNAFDMQRVTVVVLEVLSTRYGQGAKAQMHLRRFLQSASGQLHPLLVNTDAVGLVNGRLYKVRQQVDGEPLAGLLERGLHSGVAVQIAFGLCDTVAALHGAGRVHGGLAPHSVFIQDGGLVALTDAGLFPELHSLSTAAGVPWGRFPYLSPEQAVGADIVPASDVYTVGLLLYEMLAGRPPFASNDEAELVLQHVRNDPPSVQEQSSGIPNSLARIVHQALAKDPGERFQNAGVMAEVLSLHLGGPPVHVPPQALPLREAPLRRQLVVPPVPVNALPPLVPADPAMPIAHEADDVRPQTKVDWVIVALLIAGLVAVLGLIPLWRSVSQRYAIPTAPPPSGRYHRPRLELASHEGHLERLANEVARVPKLDDLLLVWYNAGVERGGSGRGVARDCATHLRSAVTCRFGSPDYGPWDAVDYTGRA